METLKPLKPGKVYRIPDQDKPDQDNPGPGQHHMTAILGTPIRNQGGLIPGIPKNALCILTASLTLHPKGARREECLLVQAGATPWIRKTGYLNPATTRPMHLAQLIDGIKSRRYKPMGELGPEIMREAWRCVFAFQHHKKGPATQMLDNYAYLTEETRKAEAAVRESAPVPGAVRPQAKAQPLGKAPLQKPEPEIGE